MNVLSYVLISVITLLLAVRGIKFIRDARRLLAVPVQVKPSPPPPSQSQPMSNHSSLLLPDARFRSPTAVTGKFEMSSFFKRVTLPVTDLRKALDFKDGLSIRALGLSTQPPPDSVLVFKSHGRVIGEYNLAAVFDACQRGGVLEKSEEKEDRTGEKIMMAVSKALSKRTDEETVGRLIGSLIDFVDTAASRQRHIFDLGLPIIGSPTDLIFVDIIGADGPISIDLFGYRKEEVKFVQSGGPR